MSYNNHAVWSGILVRRLIDQQIRAKLVAGFPSLNMSKSRCPEEVLLSRTPRPRCEMNVDGQEYPVLVWWEGGTNTLRVQGSEPIIVMAQVEPVVEVAINHAGRVRCGPPAARVLAVGDHFSCPIISGKYAGTFVELKVLDNFPHIFVFRRKDIPNAPEEAALDALEARQKKQIPTVASGPVIEHAIARYFWLEESRAKMPIQRVTCPTRVDLSADHMLTVSREYTGMAYGLEFGSIRMRTFVSALSTA